MAAGMLLAAAFAAAGEDASESLSLMPGVSIERPLASGGKDRFRLELAAGRHWLVTVDQLGVDAVVEVTDPQGQSLLTADNPAGREGTESLLLTPAVTGVYGVEVRCEKQGVPNGRYEIRLDELPAATPENQLRLQAEATLTDVARLYASTESGIEEQALAKLREAVGVWRTLGESRREARTLFLIGRFFDLLEEPRKASANYAQALALRRQLDDRAAVAATLERLGRAHKNLGEYRQAVGYLEEAVALRQAHGQPEHEARTHNLLCLTLQKLGRFRAASECFTMTLALARELDDTELEAHVLNNLGGTYSNLGEPAKELQYLRRALELRRTLGDELDEAISYNNLGALHRRLGEIEQALLYYSLALAIFERLDNRYWQARTLNNMGFAYLTVGELERARAFLLRALPLRRDVGDKSGESVTLLNLSRAFSGLGETGKALAFCRKALANQLAAGNRRGVAAARRLLGELHLEHQEPTAASSELELALANLREMGKRGEEAEVLELLSRARLGTGEPNEARALAARALDLQRAVRSPVGEATALTALARAERELERYGAMREHLETAIETLETLHGLLGDPSQRASFLASQRETHELYVDLLMELHRQAPAEGHELAALEASERARSRSLLGLLAGSGAGLGDEVEPALAGRLRSAEQKFAVKTRRQIEVLSREHTPERALEAEQELYAALTALDLVRAEVRRRSPRYAALSRPQLLDATDIRDLLDPDTVLLEFFLGEKRSFLWWVTAAAVTTYELPPRAAIETLAIQVHQQVGAIHRGSGTTRETLEALGRMLLGPTAGRLDGQRLAIVSDGALHLVPFAALASPRTRKPLLEHHEVVYLPSASVLALQRSFWRPEGRASKTVAILADPIFDRLDPRLTGDPRKATAATDTTSAHATRQAALLELDDLGRLPHTLREAEAIAALVPAEQRLLATGGEARRSRVVSGELDAYRILHFATHGFINLRNPELSGLVLSRLDADGGELDGFLGLHDVSSLELSAELVVLSGCRTALGKQIRGEGQVGLTRGFMYAGVPRVVASFWQVRDEATAELMARFYRAMLVQDLPPAAALRAAQLGLRQERRWRDPFYWAAFSLQGDWL